MTYFMRSGNTYRVSDEAALELLLKWYSTQSQLEELGL